MRKSRFTEAQIVGILKELDAGTPAIELARKHGVHANTIPSGGIVTAASRRATWYV
ncbi:MAG: transposase [Candidatus Tyrphobacter sp.]